MAEQLHDLESSQKQNRFFGFASQIVTISFADTPHRQEAFWLIFCQG